MSKKPWKSWQEVLTLREDLRSGELPLHMFSADLYEVMLKNGKKPIYEDPEKFFAITFPTYNMQKLVRDVLLRVAGKNDKAVHQLKLTYGGGKTHTLITLKHMVTAPDTLPELPSIKEFKQILGQAVPKAQVAALCFDKLDVERGMEVPSHDCKTKFLRHPWSVLAYQIAGDHGLQILHADNKAEERETAPAENLLTKLLESPIKQGMGTLILIDEVLMYAREKIAMNTKWRDRLLNFFQYLTQAATKVDRCCIVASLLDSKTSKGNQFNKQFQEEMYNIFQRQREEAVEPVLERDIAEILRRRFFIPESTKFKESFRPHVQAAMKGVIELDEQTKQQGVDAEELYLHSYPFHPNLIEIFYSKWMSLNKFQRTRGILRVLAMALREADQWDDSPLVDPGVFLLDPKQEGLSEAMSELVTVADIEKHEGKQHAWPTVLEKELQTAKSIQKDAVGLKRREIEKAVISTFLHSQPIGQHAKTRDLKVLISTAQPDKLELEKGLTRWGQASFWLDDKYTAISEGNELPHVWRLSNRPNLIQMHTLAASKIPDSLVHSHLLDEICNLNTLWIGAATYGIRIHKLPIQSKEIKDDGQFHYGILRPSAVSDSGKPSPEAKKFINETTGPEKPRVYRNSVILLAPSKNGLNVASNTLRQHLAWKQVSEDIKKQAANGKCVDATCIQTLNVNMDKAKGRIQEAIKQAYCIVVTVSEKNSIQAFKINVTDAPHFETIKNDLRSRIQDTSISAEALLPDGPYNLWKTGETSRQVKDLSRAFAQLPHLPKMLKSRKIINTLMDGCKSGTFVLKLTLLDGSTRTWWLIDSNDDIPMNDPSIELVLPEAAELQEIFPSLLEPGRLQDLWSGGTVTVQKVLNYFAGDNIVHVQREEGYTELMTIPRAAPDVVNAAITKAVEAGTLWFINGETSLLGEPIPFGVSMTTAVLHEPPNIAPAQILSANLKGAWQDGLATASSLYTALAQQFDNRLPWKVVRDTISSSIQARFIQLAPTSGPWPCDLHQAEAVKLITAANQSAPNTDLTHLTPSSKNFVVRLELTLPGIQALSFSLPTLFDIKEKNNLPMLIYAQFELGNGTIEPDEYTVQEINKVLGNIKGVKILR